MLRTGKQFSGLFPMTAVDIYPEEGEKTLTIERIKEATDALARWGKGKGGIKDFAAALAFPHYDRAGECRYVTFFAGVGGVVSEDYMPFMNYWERENAK